MNDDDIRRRLDVGLQAVLEAGRIALEYFRRPMDVADKSDGRGFDPVTAADRRIEALIRDRLDRCFPGERVVGEEYGSSGNGETCWTIDPIDGTKSFVSGMPTWGTMLGLCVEGRAVVGIVHQPFLRESYIGDVVDGARLLRDGQVRPLRSRASATLRDAVIYSTHPSLLDGAGISRAFAALAAQCRLQRWGGDCYGYALVAAGCIDLMVDGMLKTWDVVPLVPIIEGAGGVITTLAGGSPLEGGAVLASANASLHAAALETLAQGAS